MDTSDRRFWVGFDLGGTKMMAAALSEEFRVLGRGVDHRRGQAFEFLEFQGRRLGTHGGDAGEDENEDAGQQNGRFHDFLRFFEDGELYPDAGPMPARGDAWITGETSILVP